MRWRVATRSSRRLSARRRHIGGSRCADRSGRDERAGVSGRGEAGVRRVVMTSAAAAARPPHSADRISDETVWADPADRQFDAYRRSKILAERAAWDFMAEHAGRTSLTTILPGAVFGPVLTKANRGSVQIIQRLLEGRPAAIPRLGFWIVDVRDLAELHIHAMTALRPQPTASSRPVISCGWRTSQRRCDGNSEVGLARCRPADCRTLSSGCRRCSFRCYGRSYQSRAQKRSHRCKGPSHARLFATSGGDDHC